MDKVEINFRQAQRENISNERSQEMGAIKKRFGECAKISNL